MPPLYRLPESMQEEEAPDLYIIRHPRGSVMFDPEDEGAEITLGQPSQHLGDSPTQPFPGSKEE